MMNNFEYGPIARGIYTAMLWLVWLVPFVFPEYFFFYLLLLIFLGLGLRPLLLKTGIYSIFQRVKKRYTEWRNKNLRQAYYKRNAEQVDKRDKHLAEMKKKMISNDNNL